MSRIESKGSSPTQVELKLNSNRWQFFQSVCASPIVESESFQPALDLINEEEAEAGTMIFAANFNPTALEHEEDLATFDEPEDYPEDAPDEADEPDLDGLSPHCGG